MSSIAIENKTTDLFNDNTGFCSLITTLGQDVTVVNSTRVDEEERVAKFTEKDRKLTKYLFENKHRSSLEHVVFQFRLKIPLFLAKELLNHRLGSFSQESRLYTRIKPEFYTPPDLRAKKDSSINDYISALNFSYKTFNSLLDQGFSWKNAQNVLPQATYTQIFWTINLRNLMHFILISKDSDGSPELKELGDAMRELAKEEVPQVLTIWEEEGYPL